MFHRSSFSPVSFSRAAFAGATSAPEAQDGRSGYWRLFFTKMQEEALRPEEEQKPVVDQPKEAVEISVEAKPAKKKKPPVKLVPLEKYEVPNFKRKPIYSNPIPTAPSLAETLLQLPKIDFEGWIYAAQRNAVIINLEHERRKRARRRAAAFLLMAA